MIKTAKDIALGVLLTIKVVVLTVLAGWSVVALGILHVMITLADAIEDSQRGNP